MKWNKHPNSWTSDGKRGTYHIFKERAGYRIGITPTGAKFRGTITTLFRGHASLDAAKNHVKAWDSGRLWPRRRCETLP